MTQSMDYTGTIKTKRLKNTGFTEDILRKAHTRPGTRIMAIVELCVDDAHNKHDAPNHVDFTIEQVVPFTEDRDEAHLRQLTRSSHAQGVLVGENGEPAIDDLGDVEPSIEKVIAAREADEDPYSYVHAKGGRGETGAETPCGLKASFEKTLSTHVDADQVTCPECLMILAEEDQDQPAPAEAEAEDLEPVPA